MIEMNDGKVAVIHEIGLVTNISKLHNPVDGKVVYNITIIHAGGTCMFTTTRDFFEQWILGISKCLSELDDKKIIVPEPQLQRKFGN